MDEKVDVLGKYSVHIGSGLLNKLSKVVNTQNYSKVFLITDSHIEKKWAHAFPESAVKVIIRSGEQQKTLDTIKKIWKELLSSQADRKSLILNIGGGVLTDLGGFAASTYMRGLSFINIPTTLLSQVDASVGGKTGINFEGIKNLIGTFDQPIAVICDIQFLETLPDREFISGFGEIIKHGLIADKKYFNFVTSKKPREFTQQELARIIFESIKIKAKIIGGDEKESGKRKLLNFGHTIGHAIEALSLDTPHPLLHGEAIGIGMIAEAKVSQLIGNISASDFEVIRQSILNAGLPISISNLSKTKILEKVQHDKKNEAGKVSYTVLEKIGTGAINQRVSDVTIKEAVLFISE